jgi:hypothetical protein
MTRTIPVSGKYSDRQKPQCGLNVKKEATKMLVGNIMETIPYRSG